MTLITFIDSMTQGKGKACMVKYGRFPARHGSMTIQAYVGDISGQMIGIGGCIKVSLMTGETLR